MSFLLLISIVKAHTIKWHVYPHEVFYAFTHEGNYLIENIKYSFQHSGRKGNLPWWDSNPMPLICQMSALPLDHRGFQFCLSLIQVIYCEVTELWLLLFTRQNFKWNLMFFITNYNRSSPYFHDMFTRFWSYPARTSATKDLADKKIMATHRKPSTFRDMLVRPKILQPKTKIPRILQQT